MKKRRAIDVPRMVHGINHSVYVVCKSRPPVENVHVQFTAVVICDEKMILVHDLSTALACKELVIVHVEQGDEIEYSISEAVNQAGP